MALQGTLPLDWALKSAVPALKALNLSGNYELSGPLPDAWGNTSAGMQSLQVFSARGCNLSGPLPTSWAGLPALGVLDMAYNYFTGEELSPASRTVSILVLCPAAPSQRQLSRRASFTQSPACWRHIVCASDLVALSQPITMSSIAGAHSSLKSFVSSCCHLLASDEAGSDASVSALSKPGAWPTAGSLPVEWQGMGALQALDLVGNGLTGSLPDG